MAFRWRADGGPLLVVLGSSLPSLTKKKKKKKNNKQKNPTLSELQSWTPSDKTFWIRSCTGNANQRKRMRGI